MGFENATGGLSAADMAAVMRGNGGGGFGNDGGYGGWWIILFFLIAMMGGWGNNGGWGNGGNGGGGAVPYIGVAADMQRGFDQQATTGQISALQAQVGNGFADAAVANCQGNANIVSAITGAQFGTAQAITSAKDVIANGLNQLAMNQQSCCCETKAGIADLKYTVATEACADRAAVTNGLQQLTMQNNLNTNTITNAINQGVQSIKDDLCADRLAAKDAQIQALQNQLNMATLAASQTAQTSRLIQDNNQQTQNIVNSCCPKPVPAYVVANPSGCGCGGYYGGCGA